MLSVVITLNMNVMEIKTKLDELKNILIRLDNI